MNIVPHNKPEPEGKQVTGLFYGTDSQFLAGVVFIFMTLDDKVIELTDYKVSV